MEARNSAYPLAASDAVVEGSSLNLPERSGHGEPKRSPITGHRKAVFIVGATSGGPGQTNPSLWLGNENDAVLPVFYSEEEKSGFNDPVVDALTSVLEFARASEQSPSPLFVTSIHDAMQAHLAHAYGQFEAAQGERRPGLTLWQERRAKRFLALNAGDDVSIAGAAEACRLSRSYFIRVFKITTGETPYRWLCRYRIETAKELLLGPLSIAEIALECGFSDQSHLTRVFAKMIGVPPGVWRREYRCDAASMGDCYAPDGSTAVGAAGG